MVLKCRQVYLSNKSGKQYVHKRMVKFHYLIMKKGNYLISSSLSCCATPKMFASTLRCADHSLHGRWSIGVQFLSTHDAKCLEWGSILLPQLFPLNDNVLNVLDVHNIINMAPQKSNGSGQVGPQLPVRLSGNRSFKASRTRLMT